MNLTMHLWCIVRIFFAGICGFAIGYERRNRAKEAGIRTHFIVATASALMMVISKYAAIDMGIIGDPTRIAAQVVSGIGFLGAGMIFVHNHAISGLTTAAGIWATSGIGMAIGGGMYVEGIAATVIILIVQTLFREFKWAKVHKVKYITLTTENVEGKQQEVERKLTDKGVIIESTSVHKCEQGRTLIFKMSVEVPEDISEQQITEMFDGDCSVESH